MASLGGGLPGISAPSNVASVGHELLAALCLGAFGQRWSLEGGAAVNLDNENNLISSA